MSTLMWGVGAIDETATDPDDARATTEPIRDDGENASSDDSPEFNELETDESGELDGLANREVAAHVNDSEKVDPWWIRLLTNHNQIVDNQVSSSGTAARRESGGEHGHGTMQYGQSIEPVIRDGASFGNDYFITNDSGIQDGAGEYMSPFDSNNWVNAVHHSKATQNSRDATQASMYDAFFNGG